VLGLASELSENGYRITVLSEPCMKETIGSLGYNFIPFQRHFTRKDRKEDLFRDWNVSSIKSPVLEKIVFGPAEIVAEESLKAIGQTDAQLLIADCLLPTALIAAEASRIPGVLAFHMPEYFPAANRPPGMFGLKPGNGRLTRFRDRILTLLFNKKINGFLPGINAVRTELNLPPLDQTSNLVHGADLRLIQTLERFDFPMEPRPENIRYTGPVLHDPDWTSTWSNPWPAEDPRPLVVISLSSTFQNQYAVIQSAIDALRDQEIRGLVTLGPAVEKDRFVVPENVVVVDSAPHSRVFPLADLIITHAGHGTVMRALSQGLPMVCLPMGRDQNDNAIKVQHHECGLALSAKAKPKKIRNAVHQILADNSFKGAALSFQKDIRATEESSGGLEIGKLIEPGSEYSIKQVEASMRYA